eukprot:TRINITY_DN1555_c0_g1_i10.p1 TRINITY_DN1555_c0_g1~~TRINITY_DN1555_c0_g1_i10.p1  ORF type:complete len:179 (-),score=38.37 TRINITY_DN1555_c0_g1_i10:120-656(-)
MAGRSIFLALGIFMAVPQCSLAQEGYDPEKPTEPFDEAAHVVTSWLKHNVPVPHKADGWEDNFCQCLENGNVASWYQYASAMYLVDKCNTDSGLVIRSGHLQDRHRQPLQGMMACDTLKLITFCLSHHAPEALPMWQQSCRSAHYTTPQCDVECSAAMPVASSSLAFIAAMAAAFFAF